MEYCNRKKAKNTQAVYADKLIDRAVYDAVKGMLPKNSLGRKMLKKLRVYKDANHGHEAQQPETLNIVR